MRGYFGLDLGLPALAIAIAGGILILQLELLVFGYALAFGALMFLVDLVNGKCFSTKQAIRELSAALGFLAVGLMLAYFAGYSYADFTNKDWYPVSRLITIPGLFLSSYGLLHLLLSFFRGQYYEENTDA